MLTITHITVSPRHARRLQIRVGNKARATLPASVVEEMGLAVGQTWDEGLAAKVAHAVECDRALGRAAKQVERRARSAAEMREKLRGWEYSPTVVEWVMARLEQLGLVNDQALGRALAEEAMRRGPVGPALLRAKLERRHLEAGAIERVMEETVGAAGTGSTGQNVGVMGAVELARQRLAAMRGLDTAARRRRLWGALARRGFDQDTIEAALREVGEVAEIED